MPGVHLFGQGETHQDIWNRLVGGRRGCDFCGDPVAMLARVFLPISELVKQFPDRRFEPVKIFDVSKTNGEPYARWAEHGLCRDHRQFGQEQIAQSYPSYAYVEFDEGAPERTQVQVVG